MPSICHSWPHRVGLNGEHGLAQTKRLRDRLWYYMEPSSKFRRSFPLFHIFMARSPLGGIGVKDVGRDFAPHKKNLQYQS